MNYLKYGIGIDMAKDKFDVSLSAIDMAQKVHPPGASSFASNPKGFAAFCTWSKAKQQQQLPNVYLMEATGIYHEQLAWYLFGQKMNVVVVLPNKAKKYKEALGLKSKTDAIDAAGLSRMACEQNFKQWQPLSKKIYEMRIITRHIEAVAAQITVAQNQLHALSYGMYEVKEIKTMMLKQVKLLREQKKKMGQTVSALVEADELLKERFSKILKIKGPGTLSLAVIIAETDGFALTENISQLTSYAGYDVVENQSGKRAGKTKISKKGNGHIRRALHFPSLNMVRCSQGNFNQLYERVYKSSSIKMKGYVAIQRKLLGLIYTLWKKNEAFDNAYNQQASGNAEPVPSFASALPASQREDMQKEEGEANKKTAPVKPRAAQDKLPSTHRRKPSFA